MSASSLPPSALSPPMVGPTYPPKDVRGFPSTGTLLPKSSSSQLSVNLPRIAVARAGLFVGVTHREAGGADRVREASGLIRGHAPASLAPLRDRRGTRGPQLSPPRPERGDARAPVPR